MSGTGAWDVATLSTTAWQHELLRGAELTTASPEWTTLIAELDAARHVPDATGAILLVNGSTDEFFPVTAHTATYDAIGGPKRTAIAANFDHGCYGITGVEAAANIEARATVRAQGGQALWFGHFLTSDPRFATLPAEPTLTIDVSGGFTAGTATVDEPDGYDVTGVTWWSSADGAVIWFGLDLQRLGPGTFGAVWPALPDSNATWYVDVTYRTDDLLAPTSFALASRPHVPAGFVPRIRAMNTCLAP